MTTPFTIEFDFPLENTTVRIHLKAVAQPGPSSSYIIHSFSHSYGSRKIANRFLLPEQYIKCVNKDGIRNWVHTDSLKETLLSMAIGEAIERSEANSTLPVQPG